MKVYLDEWAKMPTRAHSTDAGLDLYSEKDVMVRAKGAEVFNTGVHIELPAGTVGFIKSKSGLNVKYGCLCEGVIDEGYTGQIKVKMYNNSEMDVGIWKGDKIAQLVILKCDKPELELVSDLSEFAESERKDNGFGSTGR